MRDDDVRRDMTWAQQLFAEIVWPNINHLWPGAELKSNEDATASEASSLLDMDSGIDWFIRHKGRNFPLAARVQDAAKNSFTSFTVREKRRHGTFATELHKRREELHTPGAMGPHLNCQAYVDRSTRQFVIAGIAQQSDIIHMVENGRYTSGWTRKEGDQFRVVWWMDMRDMGLPVKIVCGEGVALAGRKRPIRDPGTWRCQQCLTRVPRPSCGRGNCANCGRLICDTPLVENESF